MRQDIKRQRGMTGMGWLTVLFLIGFFALLTFKLVPIYLENNSVKSILSSMEKEPLITKKDKSEILAMLFARLRTNGIRDMKRDSVKITKRDGVLTIDINYSVQKNMIGNVDVIVTFNERARMISN